jgi:hypothetical protein
MIEETNDRMYLKRGYLSGIIVGPYLKLVDMLDLSEEVSEDPFILTPRLRGLHVQ